MAWLKGWRIGFEIYHYSCDLFAGKDRLWCFGAFLAYLKLVSVLLRLNEQVICLRRSDSVQMFPGGPSYISNVSVLTLVKQQSYFSS